MLSIQDTMEGHNTYHEDMEELNLPQSLGANPFTVPENYFEELTQNIKGQVKITGRNLQENPFSVPNDYFQNANETLIATARIKNKIEQQQNGGMQLPTDYFNDLSARIKAQVSIDTKAQKETFSVPTGYFNQLTTDIQGSIAQEKLREQVSTTGFTTPSDYFEQLTKKLQDQTTTTAQQDKPVRMLSIQRWIRYAAAACVATVLGLASYHAIAPQAEEVKQTEQLAGVSDAEILNYLAYTMDSNDLIYVMESLYQPKGEEEVGLSVDKEDIEDYLKYML